MKQYVSLYLLNPDIFMLRLAWAILFLWCALGLRAQGREDGVFIYVVTDSMRQVEVCVSRDTTGVEAIVGESQYHHPAVPKDTRGRVVLPSMVTDAHGRAWRVTGVARAGMQGCVELTEVVLPDSCVAFGDQAFQGCKKLESITLPATMKVMYAKAMSGCESLRRVTSLATTPPQCDENVFDEYTYQTATLVVPAGSEDAYRRASAWRRFKYRMVIF